MTSGAQPPGRTLRKTLRKTLVVTGVDGFIGSHIARAAADSGWRVVGIHRPGPNDEHGPHGPGIDRVPCDLLDPAQQATLEASMAGAHAVVHAAARVQLYGRHGPLIRENASTTLRVLEAAKGAGAPRFVFLSSASVLFEARDQPGLLEVPPPAGPALSGYAASKRASEALVEDYPGSWAILRPQAVIGPGDRALMPPVLRAARSGRWRWIGPKNEAAMDLVAVTTLVDYVLRASAPDGATGLFHITNGEVRFIEGLFRQVFEELHIQVGEARIGRGTALALSRATELPMRWLAPSSEPPLTRFALEVLTRTRTLDQRRTLAAFGGPSCPLDTELERTVQWFQENGVTP